MGRKPRRGCSALGAESGLPSWNTPEGPSGRGAQARRPLGSPWGDGRRVGAVRRRAGKPQGGRSPGGERTPASGEQPAGGSGLRVREAPRTGSRAGGRFRTSLAAAKCTAGGQPTSWGSRASKEVPTDLEEQAPEGRSPGALRHETGPGGLAGRKPARGWKPWGRNVAEGSDPPCKWTRGSGMCRRAGNPRRGASRDARKGRARQATSSDNLGGEAKATGARRVGRAIGRGRRRAGRPHGPAKGRRGIGEPDGPIRRAECASKVSRTPRGLSRVCGDADPAPRDRSYVSGGAHPVEGTGPGTARCPAPPPGFFLRNTGA